MKLTTIIGIIAALLFWGIIAWLLWEQALSSLVGIPDQVWAIVAVIVGIVVVVYLAWSDQGE